MNLDLQFKINNDANLKRYLRENSYWYKILNRDPTKINELTNEMKEHYRLRPTDKINDIAEKMKMINMFLNVLR